ncbi:MAG: disulfide bond formation protein B [Zoogloeaceae bacterium]|jgi:disulfide bond formation protein DsbB|nr:disulfide bond formation protein B [Zoogloeaceae bacterium]
MLKTLVSWLDRLPARTHFLLVGLAAWGVCIAGLLLQHFAQLEPCPLCIFQRLLFMVLGTLALLAALFVKRPGRGCQVAGLTLILPCLAGFGVAVYQTLMQSAPTLVQECDRANPGPIENFVDWLGIAWMEEAPFLPELFFATGQCSSKEWVFIGLSLANWSALFFCIFALFILLVCWFSRKS